MFLYCGTLLILKAPQKNIIKALIETEIGIKIKKFSDIDLDERNKSKVD